MKVRNLMRLAVAMPLGQNSETIALVVKFQYVSKYRKKSPKHSFPKCESELEKKSTGGWI